MMRKFGVFVFLALAGCSSSPALETAAQSDARAFSQSCAACHGDDARGSGPMAHNLLKTPPDLTGLALYNGGVFPTTYVLGVLEGHARWDGFSGAMPEYSMQGPRVQIGEIGASAPAGLAPILRYLASVQR